MGSSPQTGVIDRDNRVFGYQNMYVCDGAAVSANPGVNPSLTITAIAERAMSRIPPKKSLQDLQSAAEFAHADNARPAEKRL